MDLHPLISEAAPLSATIPLFRQAMRRIPPSLTRVAVVGHGEIPLQRPIVAAQLQLQ